jgi:hypothetical protein
MTNSRNRLLIRLAPLLIVIPAYLSVALLFDNYARRILAYLGPSKPPYQLTRVEQLEVLLRPVKGVLPACTEVGYVSDDGIHNGRGEDFRLSQYVLAPVLLTRDLRNRPQYVIGYFRNPHTDYSNLLPAGYELKQNAGNGVKLFCPKTTS